MARRKPTAAAESLPTEQQVAKFEMLSPMLDSAWMEMSEFAKKKQDGVRNLLKVKLLNRLLREAREVLGDDPGIEYLDLLDEESLPQNSDAVLILGQFRAALKQFREKYFGHDRGEYEDRWFTQEHPRRPE